MFAAFHQSYLQVFVCVGFFNSLLGQEGVIYCISPWFLILGLWGLWPRWTSCLKLWWEGTAVGSMSVSPCQGRGVSVYISSNLETLSCGLCFLPAFSYSFVQCFSCSFPCLPVELPLHPGPEAAAAPPSPEALHCTLPSTEGCSQPQSSSLRLKKGAFSTRCPKEMHEHLL